MICFRKKVGKDLIENGNGIIKSADEIATRCVEMSSAVKVARADVTHREITL